ncbi:aldo/keto reductase [Comamonas piscis]
MDKFKISTERFTLNRRGMLQGMTGLASAAFAATSIAAKPGGLDAATGSNIAATSKLPADIHVRKLPNGEGVLPLIGLGTFFTFDQIPGANRNHLKQVVKNYWDGGARVIDTSPLYGTAQHTVGSILSELNITDQAFISDKVWATGEFFADDSHAERSLEQSQARLWREKIDLMHCHSLTADISIIPLLNAWKREGRIRYIGASHNDNAYHPILGTWMQRGAVDFVQLNYSIFNRNAEKQLLPLALEKGIAVHVNMPLEKARLHKLVEGRAVPDFAKDFAPDNWSQFFLKWVIAHPAVSCAIPSTSNPVHALENISALKGPLPDQAMRQKMLAYMESIPGFSDLGKMPQYPGKNYAGVIARAQAKQRARGQV